jgi:hypothetical protein
MKLRHFIYTAGGKTTMSSIEHQIIESCRFIDDYLKAHPSRTGWRRSPNNKPAFTDAEVLTIALLQGSFGCATLKKAYLLVRANWLEAFPHLCSYKQWLARLHALTALVGPLIQAARPAVDHTSALYLIDSKPIPVWMVVLLSALAHNVVVWSRAWLAASVSKIKGYGVLRMVRDVFAVNGLVEIGAKNSIRRIVLSDAAGWARRCANSLRALLKQQHVRVTLGEI